MDVGPDWPNVPRTGVIPPGMAFIPPPTTANSRWSTRDNQCYVRLSQSAYIRSAVVPRSDSAEARYGKLNFDRKRHNIKSALDLRAADGWNGDYHKFNLGDGMLTIPDFSGYCQKVWAQWGATKGMIWAATPLEAIAFNPAGKTVFFVEHLDHLVNLDVKFGKDSARWNPVISRTHFKWEIYRRSGNHIDPWGCREHDPNA